MKMTGVVSVVLRMSRKGFSSFKLPMLSTGTPSWVFRKRGDLSSLIQVVSSEALSGYIVPSSRD